MSPLKIGVMGAGAVGAYVGGRLAAAGADVVLVGRPALGAEIAAHGLSVAGLDGADAASLRASDVVYRTTAASLADRDVVLCCVKSAQTAEVARELAAVLPPRALVVSLQNGIGNAEALRASLPRDRVRGGIVGFNVVWQEGARFRQATTGPLVIESAGAPEEALLAERLRSAGFAVELTDDLRPLQWAKLVMNLNNAVSALTGEPTRTLLFGEGYRRSLAALMEEAIGILRATGTTIGKLGPLPVRLFPWLLRLPAPLLRVVASAQLKVDAEARSSMWEDLVRGRDTEIDYLNGEIVKLAKQHGLRAPRNERVVALVHEVERRRAGSPKLDAAALWAAIEG
ncbi:MAG: 2-dehydropantoate 2-reductase [Labilithrix sp.]|nr:2-dehydropantoate 2-reductase [Labilithrix sp.]